MRVQVECEGEALFDGDAWQVTVAALGAFGAGSRIAEADPHDGALEVVAVSAGPRPGLVALAYRLRSGRLAGHRRARRRSGTLQRQQPRPAPSRSWARPDPAFSPSVEFVRLRGTKSTVGSRN